MATQSPGFSVPLAEFAASLLAEREINPRGRLIAQFFASLVPDCAVIVYAIHDQDAPAWAPAAIQGEAALHDQVVEFTAGTLGQVAERREPLLYEAGELEREAPSENATGRQVDGRHAS